MDGQRNDAEAGTEARTAAHWLIEALVEVGIEHLFVNLGTDHAPIIEEMARWRAEGRETPNVVICPHEGTAAHMAAGYALATGRGQGVLVHVDVGTTNAATAVHNMYRSRLPVLLMAGKAPFTSHGELPGTRDNYVHFIQEPYDQGAVVRPYVKWEYTLPSAVNVKEVVRRAHTVMQSGARGPVYLMLPREVLTGTAPPGVLRDFPVSKHGAKAPESVDPAALVPLAEKLVAAERPLIVTSYGGQTKGTSEAIERLSELTGAAVVENALVNNVNHEMRCFAGGTPGARLGQADVGLVVDSDVPWIPSQGEPDPSAFWAHIDIDVLKTGTPVWSFPADLRIEGNSAQILGQLCEAVEARLDMAARKAAAQRVAGLEEASSARKAKARAEAEDPGESGALNPRHIFAALGRLLDPEDMILHEAVRNQPAMVQQIPRPLPGTMIRTAGGGLGASGGMALGVKLARPETTVVQIVGDGAFYYNSPASVLAVAKQYDLPMLTVVLDNQGWSAVKQSTLRVYPDGAASLDGDFASDFRADTDFAAMAAMFGFAGFTLSEPRGVDYMLREALETVRGGQSALVHVRLPRH